MPKLTVEGYGTFDVADNKRLVLAIEQDAKVDILHACGGNARCTTCRVEFIEGEPARMTAAEKERLEQRGLSGVQRSRESELTGGLGRSGRRLARSSSDHRVSGAVRVSVRLAG